MNDKIIEFLDEVSLGGLALDEALQDYGHLFEGTEIEQAYLDYMDARAAIKKTLKRVARENNLNEAMEYIY